MTCPVLTQSQLIKLMVGVKNEKINISARAYLGISAYFKDYSPLEWIPANIELLIKNGLLTRVYLKHNYSHNQDQPMVTTLCFGDILIATSLMIKEDQELIDKYVSQYADQLELAHHS